VTGRREANKQRTRETLERVALQLFLDQGYQETTVPEIAAAAEVAERTFFRYFPTKADVLFARQDEDFALFSTGFASVPVAPAPAWSEVHAALRAFAEAYEPTRERNRLHSRLLQQDPSVLARASGVMGEWRNRVAHELSLRHGRRVDDPDIQLLAGVATAVLGAAGIEWLESGRSYVEAVDAAVVRLGDLLGGGSMPT
jgi:AcrR family transcriptional regulator